MGSLVADVDPLRVVAVIGLLALVTGMVVAATWRLTRWIADVNQSIDKIDKRLWDLEHKS